MKILNDLPEVGLLTRGVEDALAQDGTESAQNVLALHSMREAWAYARHVCRGKLPDDEIYSLCYTALKKAAKNFEAGRIRFFAYSKPYVRGELSRAWRFQDQVKHASLHETEVLQATAYTPAPYDNEDRKEGTTRKEGFVESDFQQIVTRERWALVKPVIDEVLSDHEKMVLDLTYSSGFSFQTTGNLLGITRSAVREAHARAIGKVRGALTAKGALFD